eukprot:47435-Rhodomonas_salina.1
MRKKAILKAAKANEKELTPGQQVRLGMGRCRCQFGARHEAISFVWGGQRGFLNDQLGLGRWLSRLELSLVVWVVCLLRQSSACVACSMGCAGVRVCCLRW